MLKRAIDKIEHFANYDIWKQKWKFLVLFLLTGLYFGVINYYIADNKWIITSIESLKYLGWIYENISSEKSLDWVKWFLRIFGVSILFWIIYWLYWKTKNFLTFAKILTLSWLGIFSYFRLWSYLISDFRFVSFLPFLIWFWIIFGIYTFHFVLYIVGLISSWYSWNSSWGDTDKPLEFGKWEMTENIKKMQSLWYDSIAKNLAKRLKEEIKKDSSPEVIGIEWEWWSGKSSFINLLKYYVRHKEVVDFPSDIFEFKSDSQKKWKFTFSIDSKKIIKYLKEKFWSIVPPTFLEFNPWHFESTTNLLDSFFHSLSEHIEHEYHIDTGSTFSNFARSIGNVSEYEIFWVKLKRTDIPTSPNYEHQRNNLNNILGSLDNPIIVIIDDLDRVSLEECKQIFQLIYLCSDLKNVHFLVSYDSEKFNSVDVPTFVTYSKEENIWSYTEYRNTPILEYIQKIIHTKLLITPELRWLKKYMWNEISEIFQENDWYEENEELNLIYFRAMDRLFSPKCYFIYSKYLSTPRAIRRLIFSLKLLINKEDYYRYIFNSETTLLIAIKIWIIFLYKNSLFRRITNEVSLVDEMNQLNAKDYSAADDIIFYPLEIISGFESVEKDRLKRLDEYCKGILEKEEELIVKDIFAIDINWAKLQAKDLKIALDILQVQVSASLAKTRWFFNYISWTTKELIYLDQFSYNASLYFRNRNQNNSLSIFLKNIKISDFYEQQIEKVKKIINTEFLLINNWFIADKVFWYLRDFIRDDGAASESWIRDFYNQLFTELKSSDFPVPAQWDKFSETLLGHVSDNIWLSVYSLMPWIENQCHKENKDIAQIKELLTNIFDSEKLYQNWWIFWVAYLLRLWRWFAEERWWFYDEWKEGLQENSREWIANFIYKIFQKHYILPRKSFLSYNSIIDRYWINFVKYQFMSEVEMWNIIISDWSAEKIGERIGEYFQDVVYVDARFSDIRLLFQYLVAMGYSYSDEFSHKNMLHWSGESDWHSNPYMKKILLHFKPRIEAYIQSNPDEEFEVNARYSGDEPRKFKISRIWENLKKVTKLDNSFQ